MDKIIKPLITGLLLGLSPSLWAAATEDEERRQIRMDCQTEGQAAGLTGTDLDEFTVDCVEELISAELINVVR